MTITTEYAPEEVALNDDREYSFTFPAADEQSIEVYEIILFEEVEYQYLVPVQDYTLETKVFRARNPLINGGTVKFNRLHSVGTQRIMFVRNTLIDQTADFPPFRPLNTQMLEFTFDKHTMIFQEIADRKCSAVTLTPITQEIIFGSYFDLKAEVLNFAVDKIFTILAEIDASADDCSDDLENT
jgi:hypothetical protein